MHTVSRGENLNMSIFTWAVPKSKGRTVEDGEKLWKEPVVVYVKKLLSSSFRFCAVGQGMSKEWSKENGLTGLVSALGLTQIEDLLRWSSKCYFFF